MESPPFIPHCDEQRFTACEYDRWLSRNSLSARWVRFWFSPRRILWLNTPISTLPQAAGISPSDRILDIGCGYGGVLLYLRRKLGGVPGGASGWEGLDNSSLMVQRAREEIRQRRLEKDIRVTEGIATKLPYDDATLDVVLSGYVVKHLSDARLRDMIREAKRVLKPGGRFCVWEAIPSRFGFMNVWNLKLLRVGVSVIHMRTAKEIRVLLEEEGFVIRQPFGHGLYYFYPPLPRAGFIAVRPSF
jgi:SAM-dependent methyltransferase